MDRPIDSPLAGRHNNLAAARLRTRGDRRIDRRLAVCIAAAHGAVVDNRKLTIGKRRQFDRSEDAGQRFHPAGSAKTGRFQHAAARNARTPSRINCMEAAHRRGRMAQKPANPYSGLAIWLQSSRCRCNNGRKIAANCGHSSRLFVDAAIVARAFPMKRVREIALAFPRGAHQEVFIEGVLRYARDQECDWSYITAPESLSLSVLDLVGWPGDGILAAINTAQEATCAASLSIPLVNISSALLRSPVPRSIVDNHSIGSLAADHLVGKGFQAYAFYGLSDVQYSKDRQAGFEERITAAGYRCVEFLSKPTFGLGGNQWLLQYRVLAEWLATLPTPCGLFAVSDYRARQAIDACRQVGLQVPEQIAVIGVDNEQIICDHSSPTLTSVARNDQLEGYRAAAMLDRLLNGKRVSLEEAPIPPLQVVERESTATFAVSDARLRQALSFLHQHIEKPITIDQITEHAGVSRRWLEYAFRDVLGETPYQYLRRQRLAMARRLLAEDPTAKVYSIAQQTGFSSAKQLAIAFQQDFGMSPREYRKSTQA